MNTESRTDAAGHDAVGRATTPASTSKRRRKTAGKRWSASSTIQWLDAAGNTVRRDADAGDQPAGSVKARVHYRLDGVPKRPTFSARTSDDLDLLRAFVKKLDLAYLENWPADGNSKPVAPTALQSLTAAEDVADTATETVTLRDLADTEPAPRLTTSRLVELVRTHQRQTLKRRGGTKKGRKTLSDYDSAHAFFLQHARYKPGDERLDILGLEPGAEWVLDDPAAPIRPADILGLIGIRATTNLRTRGVNDRRLAKWHKALEAAQRSKGTLQVPAMPELIREQPTARTVEAFCQQLGVLLGHAFKYELIPVQLWTQAIKDEVPHAGATSYTTRTVPARDEVADAAKAIGDVMRTFRDRDGTRRTVTGERYQAMVWVAGREGPRPEEVIAIRDSWVILDAKDPRIVLHQAEVIQPSLDGQPRERVQVPLKHRAAGQIRVLRPAPQDRAEFIEVLTRHREKFVDRTGEVDPYFFTTETGRPVDLSNFNDNWWSPARDAAFSGHLHFSQLPFRRLRAAAITDWLVVGRMSTASAAEKAGNSQAVLEKHYKGVLDARAQDNEPYGERGPQTHFEVPSVPAAELTDDEILAREAQLQARMAALRVEFASLQQVRVSRF